MPALNAAGHVAFVAHIAGGRAPEGVLAGADGPQAVALAGDDARGMPTVCWLPSMNRRTSTTSWLRSPLCGAGATCSTCYFSGTEGGSSGW